MIRFLWLAALLCHFSAYSQTPADLAIPITASAGINPPAVLLSWPSALTVQTVLKRRVSGSNGNSWETLVNQPPFPLSGYYDTNVASGFTYEYELERQLNGLTSYGYAHVGIFTPAPDSRGKLLVFIDSTTADILGNDLKTYKDGLRGEGWQTVPFKTGPFTTVSWIKNTIVNAWNADPGNIKAILLIGPVPVPYSGSTAWDDQPDHTGAWPCDAFYGDIDGVWTDNTVNLPNTSRVANRNVPGDGKFDQNILPSAIEIPVGRLDFRHLNSATFGASPVELLRKYLLKNHRWRSGESPVTVQALVDDPAGWNNGEAYAADGFRNAYPLVGQNAVVEGDFLNNTNPQRYLLGFGAATAGAYNNAVGVGSSGQFANDTVQVVFANLSGNYYFGDWDFETNPLMPAMLASKGSILTCAWAGRPSWMMQGLASGETIGFCLKETQNAQFNTAYGNSTYQSAAHISLLGDPTLRARVVRPPASFTAVSNCNKVNLHWTASPDANIVGYHVYRATALDGPYFRLTPQITNDLSFIDQSVTPDTFFYAVRAVRLDSSPGGGAFFTASTSSIQMVVFVPGTGPTVLGLGGNLNCNTPSLTLGANFQPVNCAIQWYKPNGQPHPGFTATEGGVYTVIATAPNGCTAIAYATVNIDTFLPVINLPAQYTLSCSNPTASFTVPAAAGNISYTLNGQPVQAGDQLNFTSDAVFVVSNSQNGCTKTYPVQVILNNQAPGAEVQSDGNTLGCNNTGVQLLGISPTPDVSYSWSGNGQVSAQQNLIAGAPGEYCLTVTAPNGCTSSDCFTVLATGGALNAQVIPAGDICDNTQAITLNAQASNGVPPYQYLWMNGQTNPELVLPIGYTGNTNVTITDANNCSVSIGFQIAAPITLLAQTYKETAPGLGDGSIDVFVLGGIAPFTYQWSNGGITPYIYGLNSGIFTVTVTSANGCTASLTVPLITVNTAAAVDEAAIKIWPNPVQNVLYISGLEHADHENLLRMYHQNGQLLGIWRLAPGQVVHEIPMENLPVGLYQVQMTQHGKRVYSGRVMKQ